MDALSTSAFAIVLVIAMYYLSYRYPLQINSSTTSPTYTDTPSALQIGKYILLFGVIVGVALMQALRSKASNNGRDHTTQYLFIVLVAMGIWGALKGLLIGDAAAAAEGALPAVAAVLIAVAEGSFMNYRRLSNVIGAFAVIAIVVEAIQVFLFHSIGRLPALAYEASVSVRFGSLLDDPNGFAILLSLLIPVVYLLWRHQPLLCTSLVITLIISLGLTQSATGIVSTVASIIVGGFVLRRRNPSAVLLAILAVPLALIVAWRAVVSSALVASVWESKSGSIDARSGSFEQLRELDVATYFGAGTPQVFIELSYVSILAHFGLLFLVGYVACGLIALHRLRSIITKGEGAPIHYGFYFFIITFLIGSFNLKLDGVWPVNVLYFVGVALSCASPVSDIRDQAILPGFRGRRRGARLR